MTEAKASEAAVRDWRPSYHKYFDDLGCDDAGNRVKASDTACEARSWEAAYEAGFKDGAGKGAGLWQKSSEREAAEEMAKALRSIRKVKDDMDNDACRDPDSHASCLCNFANYVDDEAEAALSRWEKAKGGK